MEQHKHEIQDIEQLLEELQAAGTLSRRFTDRFNAHEQRLNELEKYPLHNHELNDVHDLTRLIARTDRETTDLNTALQTHVHCHDSDVEEVKDDLDTLELHCNKRLRDHAAIQADLLRRITHLAAHNNC